MPSVLSLDSRQDYLRDGIIFPLRVLDPEEAGRFRRGCDELEGLLGGKPRTIEVRQMHLHFRWAYELATHPRILDHVADLLGPDLLIWATELFAKWPSDANVSIAWHRDFPYMRFDCRKTLTAWIALSPSTPANGGMRAVPRSRDPEHDLLAKPVVDQSQAIDVVLAPGEMSVHDAEVLHGSGPNHSSEKRVGFAIRYITPEARPLHGRPHALLARGEYRKNDFEIVPPPADMPAAEALAGMRKSAGRHFEAILQNLKQSP